MTATAKTATESYVTAHAEALRLLDAIRDLLTEHKHQQGMQPNNWGYVGDMDRWVSLLREVAGEAEE